MRNGFVFVLGLVSAVAISSCGKKKSKIEDQVNNGISNTLAIGYPDGLSIPSFPQTTAGATALNLDPNDTKGQTLEQKREDQKKILEGNTEDCFENLKARLGKQGGPQERCYEFDQEMIYGYRGNDTNPFGTTNGLSRKDGSQEVCMVSFARSEMQEIELQIDGMLDRAQAMACLAKKNGKALPDSANQELDMTSLMNEKRPTDKPDAPQFSSVKLRRLADVEGRPVYQTEIKSTRSGGVAEELTILHSPASSSDNNTYNGIITVKRSGDARDDNKTGVLSIEYARAKDGDAQKIRASVRRARFSTAVTELFDSTGRVNLQGLATNADNNVVNAISLVEFDMNQSDNTGSLVYWKNPGGSDGEAARGFVFKVDKDSSGKLKGCSISGAVRNVSIRKSLRNPSDANLTLKPTGFYHPFFHGESCSNPNGTGDVCSTPVAAGVAGYDFKRSDGSGYWKKVAITGANGDSFTRDQTGPLVSRQCFIQNDAGQYVIDGSANLGDAGFELIETTSEKFIAPPKIEGVKDRPLK